MKKIVLSLITTAVMTFGLSQAMAFKPAVVFDMGGKFDKSFNEGIWNGTEKFREETGIKFREFEVHQEAQREQFLRKLAQRGSDVVIAVGFAQAPALQKHRQNICTSRTQQHCPQSRLHSSTPVTG